MTHDLDPTAIHTFGRSLRERLDHGAGDGPPTALVSRFSPGNSTVYELTFMPITTVATELVSPGEYPALRSIQSETGGDAVLISKTNGTTWSWWMGLNNGYCDPGYVRQATGMGWGDVAPVGLMLNGFRYVSMDDLVRSPYLHDDGRLNFDLG